MSEKIVLIDGHSIINRAFYGVPDLTNAQGLHTNAVYGFLNILFKFLDEEKPDFLTVAFDVKHKTFRHEMFAEYKGTRKPMPGELHEQVPVLKELLGVMNIQTMEMPGYEADDLLGTLAKRAAADGADVRIVSGDRDLLQLATDKIMIRIPKTKMGKTEVENYFAQDVLEKYQVSPSEFIDLKALMGDTADNIPGVAGIGEKGAQDLIGRFGSIEYIYENLETAYKEGRLKFRRTIQIDEQHRMHPTIGSFISREFYDGTIQNGERTVNNKNDYRMFDGKNVVWIDMPIFKGAESSYNHSYARECEVDRIIELIKQFLSNNEGRKLDIGIISFYKGQVNLIDIYRCITFGDF